jgi:hypothetical protein
MRVQHVWAKTGTSPVAFHNTTVDVALCPASERRPGRVRQDQKPQCGHIERTRPTVAPPAPLTRMTNDTACPLAAPPLAVAASDARRPQCYPPDGGNYGPARGEPGVFATLETHDAARVVPRGSGPSHLGKALRRLASFVSGLLAVCGRLVDAIFGAV